MAQVTHHENSRLHWSELPRRFLDTLPAHDRACGSPRAARACARSIGLYLLSVQCMYRAKGNA